MDSTETAPEADAIIADVTEDAVDPAVDISKQDVPVEIKKALQKANKEAETLRLRLKEFEDRDKSDAQKIEEERDALRAERDSLHMEQMRRDVAEEKGLTPAQARRLVGATRDELEADAEDVLATFPIKAKPVFGDVGQGTRNQSAQRVYTTAELANIEFFREHKTDILLAQREGRITN